MLVAFRASVQATRVAHRLQHARKHLNQLGIVGQPPFLAGCGASLILTAGLFSRRKARADQDKPSVWWEEASKGASVAKEFQAALNGVDEIIGDVPPTELTMGLVYLFTENMIKRQKSPEKVTLQSGVKPRLMEMLIKHASFADIAYLDSEREIRDAVKERGYELVYAVVDSTSVKPAHYVAFDPKHRHCIVAVRGTKSLDDVFTNVSFSDAPADVIASRELSSEKARLEAAARLNPADPTDLSASLLEEAEQDAMLMNKENPRFAHRGMMASAHYLLDKLEIVLRELMKGYTIHIVGHSLGAGTATLLTYNLREKGFRNVECHGFATPCCASESLAAEMAPYTTCVVLNDDLIPRVSAGSITELRSEIQSIEWDQRLASSINDVLPLDMRSKIMEEVQAALDPKNTKIPAWARKATAAYMQSDDVVSKTTRMAIFGKDGVGNAARPGEVDASSKEQGAMETKLQSWLSKFEFLKKKQAEDKVKGEEQPAHPNPREHGNAAELLNAFWKWKSGCTDVEKKEEEGGSEEQKNTEKKSLLNYYVPGSVIFVQSPTAPDGSYRAGYIPRDESIIRRVALSPTLISDHMCLNYIAALAAAASNPERI